MDNSILWGLTVYVGQMYIQQLPGVGGGLWIKKYLHWKYAQTFEYYYCKKVNFLGAVDLRFGGYNTVFITDIVHHFIRIFRKNWPKIIYTKP